MRDEYYDDEYDDLRYSEDDDARYVDDDLDEDGEDEESSQPRARANPFASSSTSRPTTGSGGSGLPGSSAGRSSATGGSGGLPASRLPGTTGSSRPASPSSTGSGTPSSAGVRSFSGTYGGAGSTPSGGRSIGASSSPGTPGSGSRFGPSTSGTPSSPSPSVGGGRYSGSGTPAGGSSPAGTTSGSRFSASSASGAGSTGAFSSGSTGRPGGGGLSGSSGGASHGAGGRSGGATPSGTQPDESASRDAPAKPKGAGGGFLAKAGQLFKRGGDKPASASGRAPDESRSGRPADRTGARSPTTGAARPAGGVGGVLSGLKAQLPFGKKEKDAKSATSSMSSTGGAGAYRSGAPASQPSGRSSTLSGAGPATAAKGTAQPAERRGFLGFLRRGGAAEKKPAARPRPAKAPTIQDQGLSLDTKLDILGVALVLGALVLFFSSLSSTKGALTEALHNFLATTFGWGWFAAPVGMLAVGVWLIARHFGEQAPVVERIRLIGIGVLFLGLLILLQFIDSFSYGDIHSLAALRDVWLPISIARGSGGGWIGAQLYYLLVSNITEVGAFIATIGWLLVGLMLTASISFYELASVLISAVRSFRTASQRRAQARAAKAAAAALQQQAPALSISKPAAEPLPASASPALPAAAAPGLPEPAPRPERPISINVGGRTVSAFRGEELPAELPTVQSPLPLAGAPARPEDKPAEPARSPSAASRILGSVSSLSLPGRSPAPAPTPPPKDEKEDQPAASGSIRGRLFGGRPASAPAPLAGETPASPSPQPPAASSPAEPSASAPAPAARPPEPARPFAPTRPVSSSAPAAPSESEPVPQLGDVMRTAAPTAETPASPPAPLGGGLPSRPGTPASSPTLGVRPFGASSPPARPTDARPAFRPEDLDEGEDDEDEEAAAPDTLASLPPARPKGTGPLPRPEEGSSRFGVTAFGARPPATGPVRPASVSGAPAAPAGSPAKPDLAERQERLNAIRAGQLTPASALSKPADAAPAAPAKPSDESDASESPAGTSAPPAKPAAASAAPPPVAPRPAPASPPPAAPRPVQPAAPFWKPAGGESKPDEQKPASPFSPPAGSPLAPVRATAPRRRREWKLPDYSTLLSPGSEQDLDRSHLLQRARIIEETLQSFGAPGKVVEVNTGPVITQFGVEPDYLVTRSGKKNRVKVGAIAQLDKDLQLALGAKSIRIEAPVPGKGYVGIEVPNEQASLVSLRDVMDSEEFKKIKSPLAIALGQSVDGTPVAADLGAMPHLLIAGTTGSGKSVCVNAIIASLLLRNTPDRLKFIMIDPKRVELTGYNGIPHLVAPVVVELERIVGVLKWVTREMDERYKRFSNAGARNIEDYNKHLAEDEEIMPYVVVIIDELADLMMLAPDETERVITRIAALARATGIHLVIATQRPSVDVVTGLIKANFPARIAFAVASSVDSRVILDQPGADRLLGRGDMLYMSGDSPAPLRLQGVFVSDIEINNINRFWRAQVVEDDVQTRPINQLVLDHTLVESPRPVTPTSERAQVQQAFWDRDDDDRAGGALKLGADEEGADGDGRDELYDEAVELVRRLNKASVSLLQRRLRIGYTRAARLIDMMEEDGIVGPAESGSKPREVLPAED